MWWGMEDTRAWAWLPHRAPPPGSVQEEPGVNAVIAASKEEGEEPGREERGAEEDEEDERDPEKVRVPTLAVREWAVWLR